MDDIDKIAKQIGLKPGHYCPFDMTNRIDSLIQLERTTERQRREIGIYQLALGLKHSKTPLTDVAVYLDTHTRKGNPSCEQATEVRLLCRELEKQIAKDARIKPKQADTSRKG